MISPLSSTEVPSREIPAPDRQENPTEEAKDHPTESYPKHHGPVDNQPPQWLNLVGEPKDCFYRTRQSVVYIIASTNRTGSYLLCEGLNATGVAGRPTEALSPEYRAGLCHFLYGKPVDFSISIKTMIRQGMTENGVFGVKVHWDQVEEVAFESRYEGEPYIFLLEDFPVARYIHLTRRNTLAQAISLYIALHTEEWWRLKEAPNPYCKARQPVFNAAEILRLEKDLLRQNKAWENFFRTQNIVPLRMDYETLAGNYRGEVGRTLDFLGQDSTLATKIPDPRLARQSDERNALWEGWIREMQAGPLL